MREEHFRDITSFGGMPIYLVVMAIFFVIKNSLVFNQLLVGLVLSYAFTTFFRIVYFKKRPAPQKYKNWLEKIDASSFPSLHAMRGAVLGIILGNFFASTILTVIFAALIIGVAVTRILLKRHDPIDSIGGMIFGLVIGFVVITYPIAIFTL